MELLSAEFFSALLAIVIIDLVLAGDNAIVIALAARSLPPDLRKKAVLWGTVGAIVVRSTMTLIVVWLLLIPGLRFLGGLALVWIAWKLLVPKQESGEMHAKPADSFWAAMKTIVIADALMGLDNVLAVAGAAKGSFVLVVLGLLISIPIVVWGSTLILKWVDRFPVIVYIGAGVLAWTAAQMMLHEPLLAPYLSDVIRGTTYAVVVGGVLLSGYLSARRVKRGSEERDQPG
ncbi:MAG TPA: TerC family protein [Burkholderiales bacterium]